MRWGALKFVIGGALKFQRWKTGTLMPQIERMRADRAEKGADLRRSASSAASASPSYEL
jgi:hypothetical protein